MDKREPEAELHFSQPVRQIISMMIVLALVAVGGYIAARTLLSVFWTNPYLNTAIVRRWRN
jgi:uncharacterized protein YneF (UPF0154 family)